MYLYFFYLSKSIEGEELMRVDWGQTFSSFLLAVNYFLSFLSFLLPSTTKKKMVELLNLKRTEIRRLWQETSASSAQIAEFEAFGVNDEAAFTDALLEEHGHGGDAAAAPRDDSRCSSS